MNKHIFCLLLMFFLTIVPCQAETEDKVYTDQDLKSLDYEHHTPKTKTTNQTYLPQNQFSNPMPDNSSNSYQNEKSKQQILRRTEEERMRMQHQQIQMNQQLKKSQEKMINSAAKGIANFILIFVVVPFIVWLIINNRHIKERIHWLK